MPGQLKEVRNRIKSVQNTQQITKAMKMVSAAKLRRATDRIIQIRPYASKLTSLLHHLIASSGVLSPLAAVRPVQKILMVVITSDRGLAGAFNSTIIKLARQVIDQQYHAQARSGAVTIMPIGKKAFDAFRRLPYPMVTDHVSLFQPLTFERSRKVSYWIMEAFQRQQFDRVDLVYAQFKNAATQIFTVEPYLPVGPGPATRASTVDFLFEPHPETLVPLLLPQILNTRFYRALLDSNASEHGARMTAMDKATENAQELLRELSIKYNRARQAAITTELTEIVSGASALKG